MRVIHVLRKPIAETSIAVNVLKYGCGGLDIDSTRIPHASASDFAEHEAMVKALKAKGGNWQNSWKNCSDLTGCSDAPTAGRWPANLIFEHKPGCKLVGTKSVKVVGAGAHQPEHSPKGIAHSDVSRYHPGFRDADGRETVNAWECEPGCPVAALDRGTEGLLPQGAPKRKDTNDTAWFGGGSSDSTFYGDAGGASRFFKHLGGQKE
jgi:hypothetical protein